MGKKKSVQIGEFYLWDIHMGLSRGPVDEVVEVRVGDRTAWQGSITQSETITIDKPELFGGPEKEGGIVGELDIMLGAPDQDVNPRFLRRISAVGKTSAFFGLNRLVIFRSTGDHQQPLHGDITPTFRHQVTALFSGCIGALNPYPKVWKYRTRRSNAGWDGAVWNPEQAKIMLAEGEIAAMNPAHIAYEALTNRDWGRGANRALMGDSFLTAAQIAVDENFGLCFRWNRQTTIEDFLAEVMDHFGATIYQSRSTGKWEITVHRDGVDTGTLPLFTPEDGSLLGLDEDESSAATKAANEVVVIYRDPLTNEDREARIQDLGSINSTGAIRDQRLNYRGIPTPQLALRIAERELRVRSAVKRWRVRLNRKAWMLHRGALIRIREPMLGIEETTVIIGSINYGSLNSSVITADVIQDVYSLPATSYSEIQRTTFSPPDFTPRPTAYARAYETPYRDLAEGLSDADLAQVADDAGLLGVVAAKPSNLHIDYSAYTRVGNTEFTQADTSDFCPTAQLEEDMPAGFEPITVDIHNIIGSEAIAPGSVAMIDDEVVRLDDIDLIDLTATFARGCADTLPANHDAGARVWFYANDSVANDTLEYTNGIQADARIVTRTSSGELPIDSAQLVSADFIARQIRPYPPARLTISGRAFPSSVTGPLVLEFAHRDRVMQADQIIDASINSIGPELGTRYQLEIWNGASRIRNIDSEFESGVFEYTTEMAIEDGLITQPRITLKATRDGYDSLQSYDITFTRQGAGFALGENLGGQS